ncbi:hypothetical protein QF038_002192 [Pseudarthrobacter sp. W1I19]|uniref:DUF5691 domain-containing protein n=1 Tax=Pseudarthrobacter sp. W1I19 TaxID=3042288 RepID=UPI00278B8606|nr:DUF5691 domain-containing protein [Pseudarthrobacter sp. W1I19]MDQ0923684.1 hypothetical protein [Pseudarthrobacter sp. W1I19]
MTWLAELRAAALVGTARHPAPCPPAELGVRPPEGPSAEESLLDQAALADAVTRAARQPRRLDDAGLAEPAPPDHCPQATGEAARLLDLLLTQPPVGPELRTQLVTDWLKLAAASGVRVPHSLLPPLLAVAGTRPSVAEHLHPAIGTRGRWLQGMLESDQGASASAARDGQSSETGDWAELAGTDATAELERLRRIHPATARTLLGGHWDNLTARERAAHLATFATNLGSDDEELLERALHDKAKGVRDTAAALLDRLPDSARAARMAARLRPLLRLNGMLRKHLEVGLPPEPDAAAIRDGIPARPRNGEPDRLARLDTIIRGAPLDTWTSATGRGPASSIALLKGETRILAAIASTAAQRADLEWVRALLEDRFEPRLLACLPPPEREERLVRYLRSGAVQAFALVEPLRDLPRPWGPELAATVLEQITAKSGGQLAVMLAGILPAALPPEAAGQCRQLLERSDDDAARRRVLRDAVQYQSFRQSLTEAFL